MGLTGGGERFRELKFKNDPVATVQGYLSYISATRLFSYLAVAAYNRWPRSRPKIDRFWESAERHPRRMFLATAATNAAFYGPAFLSVPVVAAVALAYRIGLLAVSSDKRLFAQKNGYILAHKVNSGHFTKLKFVASASFAIGVLGVMGYMQALTVTMTATGLESGLSKPLTTAVWDSTEFFRGTIPGRVFATGFAYNAIEIIHAKRATARHRKATRSQRSRPGSTRQAVSKATDSLAFAPTGGVQKYFAAVREFVAANPGVAYAHEFLASPRPEELQVRLNEVFRPNWRPAEAYSVEGEPTERPLTSSFGRQAPRQASHLDRACRKVSSTVTGAFRPNAATTVVKVGGVRRHRSQQPTSQPQS